MEEDDEIFMGPLTVKELKKLAKVQKKLKQNRRKTVFFRDNGNYEEFLSILKLNVDDLHLRSNAAVVIQSLWRMFIMRRNYLSLRGKVAILQSSIRGYEARKLYSVQQNLASIMEAYILSSRVKFFSSQI
jgi:hypothetical protein